MPYKSREKRLAYFRKYYYDHREESIEKAKRWNRLHREKRNINKRLYYQRHRERLLQKSYEWRRRALMCCGSRFLEGLLNEDRF